MRLPAAAIAALLPTLAIAAMPPETYEAARRDAPDVIVVAIAGVTPPAGNWGECGVVGTVLRVERGDRLKVGDPITIAVPCAEADAPFPDSGVIYQDLKSLISSTYGRAFLAEDGTLALYQYDQLTDADL
jgi:hypothetical protein